MSMCNSTAQARAKWSWWNPLSGLGEILVTSCLVQVLTTRSCADPAEIHWNPLKGPCLVLHRSLWEALVKILLKSSKKSFCGLAQILMRRPCADPSEVLSKRSLRDLEQVLVKRSCGDLGEVLAKRSLLDLVQASMRSCGNPGEKMLRRSCSNPP